MTDFLSTLTPKGRAELEDAARTLGAKCMECAFGLSAIGGLVPNRSMKPGDIRDAFLSLVEGAIDRFYSASDPSVHALIEASAKSVLPPVVRISAGENVVQFKRSVL